MMRKEELLNHFSGLLDSFLNENNYFKFWIQEPEYLEYNITNEDGSIAITSGASRACIIENGFPYVVKFDLSTADEYMGTCLKELDIYNEAVMLGLDRYLAQPIPLGYYDRTFMFYDISDLTESIDCVNMECPFDDLEEGAQEYNQRVRIFLYAYPRAESFYWFMNERSIRSKQRPDSKANKNCNSPLTARNDIIGIYFENTYGTDEFERFSDFLEGFEVNDLHSENVMMLNGNFILTDYAGY